MPVLDRPGAGQDGEQLAEDVPVLDGPGAGQDGEQLAGNVPVLDGPGADVGHHDEPVAGGGGDGGNRQQCPIISSNVNFRRECLANREIMLFKD